MYLETILLLSRSQAQVRRVDIAAELGVSKPSVTNAIKSLTAKGYVYDDAFGGVQLTEAGRDKAEAVYERHHLITRLLLHIGADLSDAEENACRMEHVVSASLMDAIRKFMNEAVSACRYEPGLSCCDVAAVHSAVRE